MKRQHFDEYLSQRFVLDGGTVSFGDEINEGWLVDRSDSSRRYPIARGIPRFVPESNYADNFGLQWNTFRTTQLDSVSGLSITSDRFWTNTKWTRDELRGKRVLEVGSGAGRFTEILLGAGAHVVSFDYSIAADANFANNESKGDLFLFQASVYEIPLEPRSFDYVFCYGVLQHTPEPIRTYRCMFEMLRPGGRLSVDAYRKIPLSKIWPHAKYSWRPLTSRMNPKVLMAIVRAYMPFWLPIDTWIRHLPGGLGGTILWRLPIPCWNYVDQFPLSKPDLLQWAIMDTVDALGARFDFPQTIESMKSMIDGTAATDAEVFYGSNGIVVNLRRAPQT